MIRNVRMGLAVAVLGAIMLLGSNSLGNEAEAQSFKGFNRSLKSFNRSINRSFRKRRILRRGIIPGAIVGGVIGSKLFNKKIVGIAIGVTVGAFIGNEIAKSLSGRQKRAMSRSTVSTIVTGKNTSWRERKSRSKGSVRVVKTEEHQEAVSLPVDRDKVTQVPPLEFIGEAYRLSSSANVRGGPDTSYKKVAYLKSGSKINVVGKVIDKPWYFVSQGGIGSGFIFAKLLKPSSSSIIGKQPKPKPNQNIFEATVADTRLCRTVEQTVTLKDGTTKSQMITACKGANGWEMQKAA